MNMARQGVSLADLAPLLLKKERATATFEPQACLDLVLGSAAAQRRRKELLDLVMSDPVLSDRSMIDRNHAERYTKALEKSHAYIQLLRRHHIVDHDEQTLVYQMLGEPLPIDVHRAMFVPTLENQMDDEQRAYWLPKAKAFEITGAYAQTELGTTSACNKPSKPVLLSVGHGSNVQGIETTAHYDPKTQEFILNSPTLTSRKWWPGGLGKTANHCVLHARLFLDGKDRGVQAFLVPLRDTATHRTLPGITLGDIGPKIGFQSVDNGYVDPLWSIEAGLSQHASFLLKCLHNPVPLSSGTSLDMLGFLQANPHAKCPARQSSDVRNPQLLLDAFQVRALQLLLRADAHKSSLHHLTQASLAHAESIVLACFYDGVVAIADASLQAAMLQLWTLYGLWRLNANLGEFRMDDHLSSAQGAWVQDELLALLAVVRPNAIALVDGFGMSDFELNSTIGRYDGDIYRALIARAATEPLNQTDVVPGYHQFLQPLLTAKL
ncbi:hypothetical protein DYB32_007447 [Aphanomyces invadans]|uniref:Acyl-coenzyme A oxidase n=2 Tax=Aphanomyces invadans TaxID=157072 RepID=A0A3R6Y4N3_9STRA|nr:hypothetical protein DYB32_007447 [Aphanomyces invadans]